MKKAYSSSSKSAQKVSFSGLFGLICHYSPNSQKNLLFALTALLFISSCKKDPVEQKVTSIAIEPSSPAVAIGLTQQLTATVLPADATNKEVTWNSNDESKATVDATGLVTGTGEGTAIITVAAKDGSNVKGTVTIKITPIKVTSIVITPSSLRVAVGDKRQLKADILPANATNKEVTWSSNDESKATVDATGLVTSAGEGTAVITVAAKDGSNVKGTVTVTVTVNVTVKATSIAITPAEPSVGIGRNLTLTAAVLPAEASQAVTWTSSDPSKATIDAATGVATGAGIGHTVITATAADGSGVAGTVTLAVRANSGSPDASVSAITLGDENFAVAVPAEGAATVLANAPRTAVSDIKAVKVNITAPANVAIKVNNRDFTQGQTVDFTNPATFTVTAQDGTAKSYTINIPAYDATSNPYGIYTVKHLADVANGLAASYLLKNNIDLPNKDAADAATATGISDYASAGWKPIGTSRAFAFGGIFDGGNFSINNFYVNRTTRVGLFGHIEEIGRIKNLGVNGVSRAVVAGGSGTGILAGQSKGGIDKCYATGNVSATGIVGGLVGANDGYIRNSYATGNVSATSTAGGLAGTSDGNISDSYATGNVSSSEGDAGGLAGKSRKNIRGSYATGNVSANYHAGGLVGWISDNGTIDRSYATGNVSSSRGNAGGLAGDSEGNIRKSYATGNVSSSGGNAGGLVGEYAQFNISDSYATGNVSASGGDAKVVGGLVGYNYNDSGTFTNCYRNSNAAIKKDNADARPSDASIEGITAKTKAEMQADAFKGNLNKTSGTVWGRDDSKNDKLPYIIGVGVGG